MTYAGGSQDITQDLSSSTMVTFRTQNVTVLLKDTHGNLLDPGTVQFYAGSWRNIGSTFSRTAMMELLPGAYSFRMGYQGASVDKSQSISPNNPSVVFQTGQVHSDEGVCTYCYAGSWRVFSQDMELLPTSYTFRFNDGTNDTRITLVASSINHIY